MSFSPGTAEGCVPWGCSVTAPYGGTRLDLMEVIALAEAGMIEAEKTYFPLDDAVSVYSRLEKGEIQACRLCSRLQPMVASIEPS